MHCEKKKVLFMTFNYCVRPFSNLDVQNQESFNLQVSKPFVFQPCPVSRAVYADMAPSHPASQHPPCGWTGTMTSNVCREFSVKRSRLSEYTISYGILGGPNHKKLEAFCHGRLAALAIEPAGVLVI
jgi:hypothetical protein